MKTSLVAAIALFSVSAFAQQQTKLSSSDRASALASIESAVLKNYVFPEKREKIVARLEEQRKAGRYDTDNPLTFAERVTEDLRAVSDDRHMYVFYDPVQNAAALRPPSSEEGTDAFLRQRAIRSHHGLTEMKILPGNIRYLKISGFEWINDMTGGAYDDAMRFLKDGDAVIVDLRSNPGGDHAAVRYLISHFVDPDLAEMTFLEGSETPTQSRTLEYLPAGRLKGKPLYVLVNGSTGSAAEAFAYDVEQFKVGEVIGEKTAGAANNNRLMPISPGFMLSVSFGRPVHPISKSNWEGVGVQPNVQAQSATALDVAQTRALTKLAGTPNARPEQLADWAWARIGAEAKLHPVSIPADRLQKMTGAYGRLTVKFENGALWFHSARLQGARLTPLTSDGLFAVDGADYLRVRFTDKGLDLLYQGESETQSFPRG